jgi:biofilm PGA synthesis N-glycosyltransferase PgaC
MIDWSAIPIVARQVLETLMSDPAFVYLFAPAILLIELPITIAVLVGILVWRRRYEQRGPVTILPKVSVIATTYSEGAAVRSTIVSLLEQTYLGQIEIVVVVDGAAQNRPTYDAAMACLSLTEGRANRSLVVLPKWQRGGLVSSINAGTDMATGEIVIRVDGDSSFDNDMVYEIVREFEDPNVPAVAGSLRVRNADASLATRLQAIEYLISIQGGKTGLSPWNTVNNISGAFGAFRRQFLTRIGGFDTHSGEDLDLTLRIKQYFGRHPNMRIPFATRAIGHTDAPDTFRILLQQRLRWDGDLVFIYMRKHPMVFSPRLLGMKNFLFTLVYGLLQGIMMPFLIVMFNISIVFYYPMEVVLAVLGLQYVFYAMFTVLMFLIILTGVTERPDVDRALAVYLPLYPIYSLAMRCFSAFAILNEIVRRGHEESNMAPWWVLRRGGPY